MDTLIEAVVDEARDLVSAEAGFGGLYTPDGMVCHCYHGRETTVRFERTWREMEGLPGWMLRHRQPYLAADAARDPQYPADLSRRFGVTSAIAAPMVGAHGELLGFVELHNKRGPRAFTPADVERLAAIAGTAAAALETALAHQLLRDAEHAFRQAEQRKDEFLATLAHELRNPIAPIRNALEMLKQAGDDVRMRRRAQAVMDRQLTQLVRIVDDLLDLSRVTRGQVALQRAHIDVQEAIANALDVAQPLIRRHGHRVLVSLPGEPLWLYADLTRLSQVFANIVTNSAKYTPPGGTIDVSVTRDDTEAVVRVKDSGIGIPREALPRVFDMFARVQGEPGRGQTGLGVGLSLVRRFVEMHGGTVRAISEGSGRGTEIVVRLPIDFTRGGRDADAVGPPQVTGHARRILVVDDNVDSADSLAALLSIYQHDVRTAHNGPSALEIAETFRPGVVVLDIGLPGMSGYDVARLMRARPWGRDVFLVAATGWGQESDKAHAIEAGFDVHLTKPVDLDQLLALLAARTS